MSMIERESTNSFHQDPVSLSHLTAYQPIVLGGKSTIHQHADASSEGCGCFTWIMNGISSIITAPSLRQNGNGN